MVGSEAKRSIINARERAWATQTRRQRRGVTTGDLRGRERLRLRTFLIAFSYDDSARGREESEGDSIEVGWGKVELVRIGGGRDMKIGMQNAPSQKELRVG